MITKATLISALTQDDTETGDIVAIQLQLSLRGISDDVDMSAHRTVVGQAVDALCLNALRESILPSARVLIECRRDQLMERVWSLLGPGE